MDSPTLNTVTTPLHQITRILLTAEAGTHHLQIGRTRYTLHVWSDAPANAAAVASLRRRSREQEESLPPAEDSHAKALRLYGSEAVAAETIRRHLATMGCDVDPGVRHRATRLADQLAKGHSARVFTEHVRVWCDAKKIHVDAPVERVRPRTNRSNSIWLRLLNRSDPGPTFSMKEVETLRRLGLTISFTS